MSNWKNLVLFLFYVFLFSNAKGEIKNSNVVHSIMFFSPTCPHCHYVIKNILPNIKAKFGSKVQILLVNVSEPKAMKIYLESHKIFKVSKKQRGVPALIVGDKYLVGSRQIPKEFPGLIKTLLEEKGSPWPEIKGLKEYLKGTPIFFEMIYKQLMAASKNKAGKSDKKAEVIETKVDFVKNFKQDPVGNGLSVVILILMILSLFLVIYSFSKTSFLDKIHLNPRIIPLLSIIGIVVASYLSYVEVTNTEAVCGPVGDCNTVQQSSYARLFGIIPIGLLGTVNYLGLIFVWILQYYGPKKIQPWSAFLIWVNSIFGTMFSIYLTFLEPFVIGATCAWCLTSAVLMTLIMCFSTVPAKQAWYDNLKFNFFRPVSAGYENV